LLATVVSFREPLLPFSASQGLLPFPRQGRLSFSRIPHISLLPFDLCGLKNCWLDPIYAVSLTVPLRISFPTISFADFFSPPQFFWRSGFCAVFSPSWVSQAFVVKSCPDISTQIRSEFFWHVHGHLLFFPRIRFQEFLVAPLRDRGLPLSFSCQNFLFSVQSVVYIFSFH